jgi:hypothetical protein
VIHPGFLKHGMFIEGRPISTLLRYRNYKAQPSILSRLVTIHPGDEQYGGQINLAAAVQRRWRARSGRQRRDIGASRRAQVGWNRPGRMGCCYSKNASTDVALASRLCGAYGINAFVADVEPGNIVHKQADTWDGTAFGTLIEGLNAKFGKDNLGISTFANMKLHPDALKIMLIAEPYVCMYAPQVYWFDNLPATYYVRQTLETWRAAGITTPLVATVQSYWDLEERTPEQGIMECKVQEFISLFADDDWRKLIGLNWYHAGGQNTSRSGAMSDPMIDAIVAGHLNYKPYAPAIPSA